MKRLVLHVGLAKTGTSSLQEALGASREALAEHGVMYPAFRPFNHSYKFTVLFRANPANSYYYKQLSPISDSDWEIEKQRLFAQWSDFFSSAETGTWIISAENLAASSEDEIRALFDFVAPFFDQVQAIAYLRHPLDLLRSQWEQNVKELERARSPEELFTHTVDTFSFRFLRRWGRIIGDENLVVCPFNPERFPARSLIADFFHRLGLPGVEVLKESRVANSSLGEEGVAFLQAFNSRYPQYVDGCLNPERGLGRHAGVLYEAMRSIETQALKFRVPLDEARAERVNKQIVLANSYLTPEDSFKPVQASSERVSLPSAADIPLRYHVDLVNALAVKCDEFIERNQRLAKERNGKPGEDPDSVEMAKRFRRIVLHIGLGKTGSTTIQQQLLAQADGLERNGILYPRRFCPDSIEFRGNHSPFLRRMFASGGGEQRAAVSRLHAKLEELEPAALIESWQAEFGDSGASTLLISAEGVGHFSNPQLTALVDWLREFSDEIKVIACIRHPRAALSSEIQQRLKTGSTLAELYRDPPYYNFEVLLGTMNDLLGSEQLVLYDFELAKRHPGGVTAAFAEKSAVRLPRPVAESSANNPSMSLRAALALNAFNRGLPAWLPGSVSRSDLDRDLLYFMSLPGEKYVAPENVMQELDRRAGPQLDWLKSTFGVELDPGSGGLQAGPPPGRWLRWRVEAQAWLRLWLRRFRRGRRPAEAQ